MDFNDPRRGRIDCSTPLGALPEFSASFGSGLFSKAFLRSFSLTRFSWEPILSANQDPWLWLETHPRPVRSPIKNLVLLLSLLRS